MNLIFQRSTSLVQRRPQFRWTLYSANHRIIGAATERFHNRADCLLNAEQVTDYKTRDIPIHVHW